MSDQSASETGFLDSPCHSVANVHIFGQSKLVTVSHVRFLDSHVGHLRSVLWGICGVSFRICRCDEKNSGQQYQEVVPTIRREVVGSCLCVSSSGVRDPTNLFWVVHVAPQHRPFRLVVLRAGLRGSGIVPLHSRVPALWERNFGASGFPRCWLVVVAPEHGYRILYFFTVIFKMR